MRHVALLLALTAAPAGWCADFAVPLPTPLQHYQTYNAEQAGLALMARTMGSMDPAMRARVMAMMAPGGDVEPAEVRQIANALGLAEHKHELLELMLHQSQVLDVLTEDQRKTLLPIVHDALLAFMDGLSEDRLAERLVTMIRLPKETPRGEKILILASRIPTLQKVGQIIARFEGIPPDIQQSLATLEDGISTMTRDELVGYIRHDVGAETMERYGLRFDDSILAEASVGAVIRGSFTPPGGGEPKELVAKVVKPYALAGLPQEMEIIERLIGLAEENAEFYGLEETNARDFFEDIRRNLEDEIQITTEQEHFRRARAYYRNQRGAVVPEVYAFSTDNVTFMEYLHVEKITDAFPGDKRKRSELARRLLRFMSYEPLFSREPTAVFHGDPHAGNVMHIRDDPEDPYRIAMLDWGLLGEFPREQRLHLVQLSVALSHGNRAKFMHHVGALLKDGLPEDAEAHDEIGRMVGEVLASGVKGTFDTFGALLEKLVGAGYSLDANMSLFIKGQITLAGIFRELDPELDQDRFLRRKASRQVLREFPKRLLFLPAWNYRGYRSLLSNGDVFSDLIH